MSHMPLVDFRHGWYVEESRELLTKRFFTLFLEREETNYEEVFSSASDYPGNVDGE